MLLIVECGSKNDGFSSTIQWLIHFIQPAHYETAAICFQQFLNDRPAYRVCIY